MVSEPMASAAGLALSFLQSQFTKYQAYQNSKIYDTDAGFRSEIVRRNTMMINHLEVFEQRCLRQKQVENIVAIQRIRSNLNSFTDDVNFGITGTTNVNTSGATLTKKQVKNLIEHDHKILQRQVKLTNLINQIQHDSQESANTTAELLSLEQQVTGVRNQFSERNNYIKSI